jgi:hypothetical protein
MATRALYDCIAGSTCGGFSGGGGSSRRCSQSMSMGGGAVLDEGIQAIKGRAEHCAAIYSRFQGLLLILSHGDETKGALRILFQSIETELRFVFGCVLLNASR